MYVPIFNTLDSEKARLVIHTYSLLPFDQSVLIKNNFERWKGQPNSVEEFRLVCWGERCYFYGGMNPDTPPLPRRAFKGS